MKSFISYLSIILILSNVTSQTLTTVGITSIYDLYQMTEGYATGWYDRIGNMMFYMINCGSYGLNLVGNDFVEKDYGLWIGPQNASFSIDVTFVDQNDLDSYVFINISDVLHLMVYPRPSVGVDHCYDPSPDITYTKTAVLNITSGKNLKISIQPFMGNSTTGVVVSNIAIIVPEFEYLSKAAISGIAIGIVVFFVIVVVACKKYKQKCKKPESSDQKKYQSDNKTTNVEKNDAEDTQANLNQNQSILQTSYVQQPFMQQPAFQQPYVQQQLYQQPVQLYQQPLQQSYQTASPHFYQPQPFQPVLLQPVYQQTYQPTGFEQYSQQQQIYSGNNQIMKHDLYGQNLYQTPVQFNQYQQGYYPQANAIGGEQVLLKLNR